MFKKLVIAASVVAAVSITPVQAESELSIYGGFQTLPHARLSGSALGSSELIKWEGKSFTPPPYYGARYLYWNDDIGYGIEATHAKAYVAQSDMPAGYTKLEFTNGHNLLTANIAKRWKTEDYSLYAGLGAGIAVPHVDVVKNGVRTYGFQYSGPVVRFTAGASRNMSENYSLFAEYQFSYSQNDVDLDNNGGNLAVDLITNALNFGVAFNL